MQLGMAPAFHIVYVAPGLMASLNVNPPALWASHGEDEGELRISPDRQSTEPNHKTRFYSPPPFGSAGSTNNTFSRL